MFKNLTCYRSSGIQDSEGKYTCTEWNCASDRYPPPGPKVPLNQCLRKKRLAGLKYKSYI